MNNKNVKATVALSVLLFALGGLLLSGIPYAQASAEEGSSEEESNDGSNEEGFATTPVTDKSGQAKKEAEEAAEKSDDQTERDSAVEQKISGIQDERLKMAEEAFLNGTCLENMDKMMLLTVPDPKAAELAMNIETC